MEHTNANEIFNKKGKKATGITAVLVAGSLVVSGVVAAALFKGNTVSNKTETTVETTIEDPLNSLLILTEDFDINDKEAVNKRAKAIYALLENPIVVEDYKEVQIEDIVNMIYILGEKYDTITYPSSAKTDEAKFEYLKYLCLALGVVLDDDYIATKDNVKEKTIPCVYMFMSKETTAKETAIEVARIYYKQRENIRNNDKDAMVKASEDYYKLYTSLETMKLGASEKFALYEQFDAFNEMFTPYLTNKQAEDLEDAMGKASTSLNIVYQTAAKDLDISEMLNEGECEENKTPFSEVYKDSDAVIADNNPAVKEENKNSTTKVVEEGGKPVSGSQGKQEVINTPTTKVENESFVVTSPDIGTTTVTVSGNTVVEEETFVVNVDNYIGTTEVYEEGGEIVGGRFVDADKVSDKNLSSTYTLG